ncbi:MAG TPA: PRC-barrel domain-containing protein [Pedobacter sp.]|jgi:sporulation protein YlmC with PRC-barrel domain
MAQNNSEHVRLKELGNSKFEVAKNESDIRGWTVKNEHGRILGKVSDLLFDNESETVLYMVLDLEGNEMHLRDRKVMAPLNIAQINEAYKNVIFPGVMANELTELPTYERGKVSTRIEDVVMQAFANTARPANNASSNTNDNVASSHNASSISNDTDSSRHTPESRHEVVAPAHHRSQIIDTSRPQTVVGVFEHSNQGQVAIEYLLDHNFKRNQIEVSSRESFHDNAEHEDHGITNWFRSVFGNENDAKTYSDAAKTGSVITVQTSSYEEAEKVAEILDKHGAVELRDSLTNREHQHHSRILDRRDVNARWGTR